MSPVTRTQCEMASTVRESPWHRPAGLGGVRGSWWLSVFPGREVAEPHSCSGRLGYKDVSFLGLL